MIVGHYASALITYGRKPQYPFWLLLLCANVPEFLWLILALLNVEPASPPSLLDATFQNLKVSMLYSHNLIPSFVQGAVVAAVVWLFSRQTALSLWCGFLTVFHVLSDLIVGFEHQLLTVDSPRVSLNTYGTMPHVAILIELLFSMTCVYGYQRARRGQGRPLPKAQVMALYIVFIVGVGAWYPTADTSLRTQLGAIGIHL